MKKIALSILYVGSIIIPMAVLLLLIITEIYRYSGLILSAKEAYTVLAILVVLATFLFLLHLLSRPLYSPIHTSENYKQVLLIVVFILFSILLWILVAMIDMTQEMYQAKVLHSFDIYLKDRLNILFISIFVNIMQAFSGTR